MRRPSEADYQRADDRWSEFGRDGPPIQPHELAGITADLDMTQLYKGQPIAGMEYAHLRSAYEKLKREGSERYALMGAMIAELNRRNDLLAEHRQTLESEGVFVVENGEPGRWQACRADGTPFAHARSEDGAWAKAWDCTHG